MGSTSTEKEKQFGMTYIHCAQSLAKIYPTVFGSWLQQTCTGRWGERERKGGRERERGWGREKERLLKCWLGVCLGQTTEYTEKEIGLHSSSAEVQTVLRAKVSNILSAQVDKIVWCVWIRQCSLGQTNQAGCQRITVSSRSVPEFIQLLWWAIMNRLTCKRSCGS